MTYRITRQDELAINQLLGECCELGDDYRQWRAHFLQGIGRLAASEIVVGTEVFGLSRGGVQPIEGTPDDVGFGFGFDKSGWLRGLELFATDPNYRCILHHYLSSGGLLEGEARRGTELIRDFDWERSQEFDEVYRTIGINRNMTCFRLLPGTTDEAIGSVFCRATKRRDFSQRDVAVVQLVFEKIAAMMGRELARTKEPAPTDLPLRVRQVLRCVLEGDGDKQIANRLSISTHTVNQYLKMIYAHYKVQSRPQLMARWIRRGWKIGPHW